jgi:hypothetical protein
MSGAGMVTTLLVGTRPNDHVPREGISTMTLVIIVLLLALLLGGVGLLVEGLFWLLIIAGILLVASFVIGAMNRGKSAA